MVTEGDSWVAIDILTILKGKQRIGKESSTQNRQEEDVQLSRKHLGDEVEEGIRLIAMHQDGPIWSPRLDVFAVLGGTVSFVTSGSFHRWRRKFEGHYRKTPLLVVIAFNSPFGLAMVLLGREPEVEAVLLFTNLVIRHTGAGETGELGSLEPWKKSGRKIGRSILVSPTIEVVTGIPGSEWLDNFGKIDHPEVTQLVGMLLRESGSWSLVFLIGNHCSNHFFQPQQHRMNTAGVEARITLDNKWPLLRD
ncbi:hypothetical protein Tco_1485237 [Tanacetum coccineum]